MGIKTSDLYLTAYLMSNDIQPQTIVTEGTQKKKIIFVFSSNPKIIHLMENFRSGQAVANIILFRTKLEYARDEMFNRLRGA